MCVFLTTWQPLVTAFVVRKRAAQTFFKISTFVFPNWNKSNGFGTMLGWENNDIFVRTLQVTKSTNYFKLKGKQVTIQCLWTLSGLGRSKYAFGYEINSLKIPIWKTVNWIKDTTLQFWTLPATTGPLHHSYRLTADPSVNKNLWDYHPYVLPHSLEEQSNTAAIQLLLFLCVAALLLPGSVTS